MLWRCTIKIPSGLYIDSPSWPLLQAHISYYGITSAPGLALGTTLVCADLANEPSYDGLILKILDGGSAGQARSIQVHNGGTLTVGVGFTNSAGAAQQIVAGVRFVILTAIGGGGGPGPAPAEGLSYYGIVEAVPGANQFTISGLAGLGAGKFAGATNPYSAFVLRDAGGASAAPQGELQAITAYVTGTGVFTTAAFTAVVAIGDEILIMNPTLANIMVILAGLSVPPIDSAINLLMRDVAGNKADTIPAMNLAPAATDSIVRQVKAILERVGDTPADPDDSLLTGVGQRDAAASADDLSDVTTTDLQAKIRRVLLRMSGAGVFSADIQGVARTELDIMLGQLATYISALGAAYSATVNPGAAAKTNIEQTLEDLGDILAGAAGIVTFPAGAAAANTVSIAEVIRYIQETVLGYEGATSLAAKLTAARAAFLDAAISSRALPGDAMALTAAERLIIQALVINDLTPFPGARIDAAITSRAATGESAAALAAVAYTRQAGVMQVKPTTIDLNQIAGTYDLFTATTQDVEVERLVIRMSGGAIGGAVTSISIQTDDATPIVFITAVDGAVANLTDEAQLAWTGAMLLDAGTGAKIRLTIAGGAAGVARVCDVVATYRAVVSGGYLA